MTARKKVIVAGGGFAGIHLARKLDKRLFDVLLIDRLNHHQFQPLFYQVATSQIEPSSISFPLRHVLKGRENLQIRLAEVKEVLTELNEIHTSIGTFSYDFLVIAIGCKTNFFGNDEIASHAFSLKSTYEAISVRNHILQTFERIISAEPEEKERLMNTVIVGAGPTGVELAGAFAEIKRNVLPNDYPKIDFSKFNVTLIEGGPRVLSAMSERASAKARLYLEKMGVRLLTQTFVKDYDGRLLKLSDGSEMPSSTVIWAAGVTANRIAGLPAQSAGQGNRIKVDRHNRVIGSDNIFAVGDIALMTTPKYPNGHPQVANVAINQAKNLTRNLSRLIKNQPLAEYEYRDLGSMATIGRNKAVVDLPHARFSGYFAWAVWMFLHLMLILSVRNKLIIFINWAWAYVTKDTALRLILTKEKSES